MREKNLKLKQKDKKNEKSSAKIDSEREDVEVDAKVFSSDSVNLKEKDDINENVDQEIAQLDSIQEVSEEDTQSPRQSSENKLFPKDPENL